MAQVGSFRQTSTLNLYNFSEQKQHFKQIILLVVLIAITIPKPIIASTRNVTTLTRIKAHTTFIKKWSFKIFFVDALF